jgi:putative membrane protein
MAGAFGREITTRYLTSFYEELGLVGASLTTAAEGAAELSTGVGSLASGLDAVATGASSTASGASELLTGVARYTDGVESLGAGLTRLSSGASQLAPLRTGLPRYASGVQGAADGFRSLNQALQANPTNADLVPSLNEFQAGLDQLADQGSGLAPAASGIGRVVEGVAAAAEGAGRLSAQAGGITSGAQGLATGTAAVSSSVASSAAGADQLVGGATELASGLEAGATQASAFGDRDAAATAGVVAEPVGITPTRNHALDSISPVIGMVFVPVGLWIGALAMFLLIRPVSRMALNSTASNGRLVLRGLGQGAAVAVVQAVSVVALLHAALGVRWDLLPATLPFSILIALVFMVVHHVLTAAFGRFGIIVSLVLLALQLTSSGGPFPLQMVAEPYQAVSSFLPLTWAVRGMQALVSGAGGPDVWASVTALSLFGLVGLAVSFWLVARLRRVRPPALLPAVG